MRKDEEMSIIEHTKNFWSYFWKGIVGFSIVLLMLFLIDSAGAQETKVCLTPDATIASIDGRFKYTYTENKNEIREYTAIMTSMLGNPPWRIDDATGLLFVFNKEIGGALNWYGGEDCNLPRSGGIPTNYLAPYIGVFEKYNTKAGG